MGGGRDFTDKCLNNSPINKIQHYDYQERPQVTPLYFSPLTSVGI